MTNQQLLVHDKIMSARFLVLLGCVFLIIETVQAEKKDFKKEGPHLNSGLAEGVQQMRREAFQVYLKSFDILDFKMKETVNGEVHEFRKAKRKRDHKILVIFSIQNLGKGSEKIEVKEESIESYRHWWP